jgi:hypothetical protein
MALTDTSLYDLLHGESRYDPQKAHEYYLRTRELKGRRSTKGFTDTQKEGLAFVTSQVAQERKKAFTDLAEAQKAQVAKFKDAAKARQNDLAKKIKAAMDQISAKASTDREKINKEAQAKVDSLPKMPTGLSKEQQAKFALDRAKAIAKIQGDTNAKLKALGDSETVARATAAKKEQDAMRSDLKSTLDQSRTAYKTARDAIKKKFEGELDKEFEAIKSNVR